MLRCAKKGYGVRLESDGYVHDEEGHRHQPRGPMDPPTIGQRQTEQISQEAEMEAKEQGRHIDHRQSTRSVSHFFERSDAKEEAEAIE